MISSASENEEEKTAENTNTSQAVVTLAQPSPASPAELEKLHLILKWLDRKSLKNETTHTEYLADFLGLILGGIGSYTAIPLGGGFGQTVGRALHASDDALSFLTGFFGAIAYVPTSVLVILANQTGLRELIRPFSEDVTLFKKDDKKISRGTAGFLKYFFAAFTGLPFMSLTASYLNDSPGTVFAVITGISCFASGIAAQSRLIDKFFLYQEPAEVKALRQDFNARLNKAITQVKHLNGPTLDSYYGLLRSEVDGSNNDFNINTLAKIKYILAAPDEPALDLPPHESSQTEIHPWTEKAINVTAITIGTAAIYTLHTATELAADWLNDRIGFEDLDTRSGVKKAATILALIPNALFSFSYIEQKIKKGCLDLINKKLCPTRNEIIATLISSASSTPNTFLAINTASTTFQHLLIAPAFLGPMLARSLAFGRLLNKGILHFNNVFYKNDRETKRGKILNILENMRETFFSVNPIYLHELNKALSTPATQQSQVQTTNPPIPAPSQITLSNSLFQPASAEQELQNTERNSGYQSSPSHVTFHGSFFQAAPTQLELQNTTGSLGYQP